MHRRTEQDGNAETREVDTLLAEIDGFCSSEDERLVVVGSTNRPWVLDEASLRRFGAKILVDLPSEVDRGRCVKAFFTRHNRNVVLTYAELACVACFACRLTLFYSLTALYLAISLPTLATSPTLLWFSCADGLADCLCWTTLLTTVSLCSLLSATIASRWLTTGTSSEPFPLRTPVSTRQICRNLEPFPERRPATTARLLNPLQPLFPSMWRPASSTASLLQPRPIAPSGMQKSALLLTTKHKHWTVSKGSCRHLLCALFAT